MTKANLVCLDFVFISIENEFILVSVPKIMLLYGGDTENVEPIHRLLNTELDRRKFGLVIIRVCREQWITS
jgi:hypothetical protein